MPAKFAFPPCAGSTRETRPIEDLQAETTYHYEAGVEQDIPGWQTTLGLTAFHIDAEDCIESINDQQHQ